MIANPSQLKSIKFSKETYITVILNGKEFEKKKLEKGWGKQGVKKDSYKGFVKGVLEQNHNPNLK